MDELPGSGDSSECAPLLLKVQRGKDALARASLMGEGRNPIFRIDLVLPTAALPDWSSLVEKCRSIRSGDRAVQVESASLDGLPPSAVAMNMIGAPDRETLVIAGNYRGLIVFLQVHREPELTAEDASAATKLFNDQVAKLEAVKT